MNPIYKAENISKHYKRSGFTLKVPYLELFPGTITGVVGENGNGKTTLLNIIAGQLKADGSFIYEDETDAVEHDWSVLKDSIAFIPQRIPRWFGTLYQNLMLKAALERIPAQEIESYLDEILDFLNLQSLRDLSWSEISTGYRLRFELARSLIGKPKLLVLDEPIANLDINTQQKFLSDLKKILLNKSYPVAVILSSQQLHEIESVADHMVFLRQGNAVFSGNVDRISDEQEFDIIELQVKNDDALEAFLLAQGMNHKKSGEYYRIEVLKGQGKSELLQKLLGQNIELRYYRDISNSTKRLFSE